MLTGASLLAALWLSGCAANTSVSSTWLDAEKRGARFDNVLVVALTQEGDKRRTFEEQLAGALNSSRTKAQASSRLMEITKPVNAETIGPLAAKIGANAIIVTKVVSLDVKTRDSDAYTDVTAKRKSGSVFRYDYVEKDLPSVMTTEFATTLSTDVIDAATGKRVYSATSSASGQETLSEVISVLSNAIAKRLRSDEVIR